MRQGGRGGSPPACLRHWSGACQLRSSGAFRCYGRGGVNADASEGEVGFLGDEVGQRDPDRVEAAAYRVWILVGHVGPAVLQDNGEGVGLHVRADREEGGTFVAEL